MKPPTDPRDECKDEDIARRRDEALLRALSTPPKPHKEMKLGRRKAKANPKGVPLKKRQQLNEGNEK